MFSITTWQRQHITHGGKNEIENSRKVEFIKASPGDVSCLFALLLHNPSEFRVWLRRFDASFFFWLTMFNNIIEDEAEKRLLKLPR